MKVLELHVVLIGLIGLIIEAGSRPIYKYKRDALGCDNLVNLTLGSPIRNAENNVNALNSYTGCYTAGILTGDTTTDIDTNTGVSSNTCACADTDSATFNASYTGSGIATGTCCASNNRDTNVMPCAEIKLPSCCAANQNNYPLEYFGKSSNQEALNIAIKAAEEAKCASDAQAFAAEAAARSVRAKFAEKAMGAARAAEVAMLGKQDIVEELVREVREAECIVQDEITSLQIAQNNAEAAKEAAKEAHLQLKTVATAVKIAEVNVKNAEAAEIGAQQDFNEKSLLLEAAKNRVEVLLRQLKIARADYASTKKAAYKATCAAQEAKQKAARDRRHLMHLWNL